MKTRVKTTEKTKKWHEHDYFVQKHPTTDAWISLMTFCRTLFMMRGLDEIVDEAVTYARERGENVRTLGGWAERTSQTQVRLILRKTENYLKVKKGVPVPEKWRGMIRLPKKGGGGVASPQSGMTVRQGGWCVIGTAIHEMTHIVHLHRVQPYEQNGKRRPHDICYNRIMLMIAKKFLKLTDEELSGHPKRHGYSIGNGYAPTRRGLDPAINKLLKDEDPRIMRFFTAEKPAEKKKRTPSKTAWLNTISAVTSCDIAWWPDDIEELNIWPHHVWEEMRVKIEAGTKLTAEELKTLASTIDEVEYRLVSEAESESYYGSGSYTKYDGRINTMHTGYRWWLENVQNAGGGV